METSWIITIIAALLIACDYAKVFSMCSVKYLPAFTIISLGLTVPHSLESFGVPIWVSVMPCYCLMMLALLLYPRKLTLEYKEIRGNHE